jgi:hypothetical protein
MTLLKILLLVLGSFARVPPSYAAPVSPLHDNEPKVADDPSLWAYLGVAAALVLLGGAFAGLTIAYVKKKKVCRTPWNAFVDMASDFRIESYKLKPQNTYLSVSNNL